MVGKFEMDLLVMPSSYCPGMTSNREVYRCGIRGNLLLTKAISLAVSCPGNFHFPWSYDDSITWILRIIGNHSFSVPLNQN